MLPANDADYGGSVSFHHAVSSSGLSATLALNMSADDAGIDGAGPAPAPYGPVSSIFAGGSPLGSPVAALFVQLVLILVVTQGVEVLLRRARVPAVMAEKVAGLILGGTAAAAVFPPSTRPALKALADLGVCLFVFLVGLELDAAALIKHARRAAAVSIAGVLAPFAVGVGAAAALTTYAYPTPPAGFAVFAVFVGTAMACTALPVLARVLGEAGLLRTRIGTVALHAAALDDFVALGVLALDAAFARAASGGGPDGGSGLGAAMASIFSLVALGLFLYFVARPAAEAVLRWWILRGGGGGGGGGGAAGAGGSRAPADGAYEGPAARAGAGSSSDAGTSLTLPHAAVVLALCCILTCAWATEVLGVHPVAGALLCGVAAPRTGGAHRSMGRRIEGITFTLLLPVYFTYSGLRTDFGTITNAGGWGWAAFVTAAALAGKTLGCALGGMAAGLPRREALAVGAVMNSKGLVEIVVLNVGLDLGVLSPPLFATLIGMSLATTMLVIPLLYVLAGSPTALRAADAAERTVSDALSAAAAAAAATGPHDTTATSGIKLEGLEDGDPKTNSLDGVGRMLLLAASPAEAVPLLLLAAALLPPVSTVATAPPHAPDRAPLTLLRWLPREAGRSNLSNQVDAETGTAVFVHAAQLWGGGGSSSSTIGGSGVGGLGLGIGSGIGGGSGGGGGGILGVIGRTGVVVGGGGTGIVSSALFPAASLAPVSSTPGDLDVVVEPGSTSAGSPSAGDASPPPPSPSARLAHTRSGTFASALHRAASFADLRPPSRTSFDDEVRAEAEEESAAARAEAASLLAGDAVAMAAVSRLQLAGAGRGGHILRASSLGLTRPDPGSGWDEHLAEAVSRAAPRLVLLPLPGGSDAAAPWATAVAVAAVAAGGAASPGRPPPTAAAFVTARDFAAVTDRLRRVLVVVRDLIADEAAGTLAVARALSGGGEGIDVRVLVLAELPAPTPPQPASVGGLSAVAAAASATGNDVDASLRSTLSSRSRAMRAGGGARRPRLTAVFERPDAAASTSAPTARPAASAINAHTGLADAEDAGDCAAPVALAGERDAREGVVVDGVTAPQSAASAVSAVSAASAAASAAAAAAAAAAIFPHASGPPSEGSSVTSSRTVGRALAKQLMQSLGRLKGAAVADGSPPTPPTTDAAQGSSLAGRLIAAAAAAALGTSAGATAVEAGRITLADTSVNSPAAALAAHLGLAGPLDAVVATAGAGGAIAAGVGHGADDGPLSLGSLLRACLPNLPAHAIVVAVVPHAMAAGVAVREGEAPREGEWPPRRWSLRGPV